MGDDFGSPRFFLKGMLWEDFEVSLWGLFGYRVGLSEKDVVEGF